jgi:hypothetical protein
MKETEVTGKYQSYGGSWMFIPTAYWNKSPRYVHQTLTHYADSEPTSFCFYSLLLHAKGRNCYCCMLKRETVNAAC